jgi:V/A-type H+-transporting ATPase subunit K
MPPEQIASLGQMGAVFAISMAAVGSALGTGAAGSAAIGAWKKCYAMGKPAPFILIAFVGFPLSQTIYGMILMFAMNGKATAEVPAAFPSLVGGGLLAGLAMGMSAWMQGKAAAGACDALAETGEGMTNYIATLGIIETVAIFVMVFSLIVI